MGTEMVIVMETTEDFTKEKRKAITNTISTAIDITVTTIIIIPTDANAKRAPRKGSSGL